MALQILACPHCSSTLRSANALAAGTLIKCSKCTQQFRITQEMLDAAPKPTPSLLPSAGKSPGTPGRARETMELSAAPTTNPDMAPPPAPKASNGKPAAKTMELDAADLAKAMANGKRGADTAEAKAAPKTMELSAAGAAAAGLTRKKPAADKDLDLNLPAPMPKRPSKKKGNGALIATFCGLLVLLLAGAGGAFYLLNQPDEPPTTPVAAAPTPTEKPALRTEPRKSEPRKSEPVKTEPVEEKPTQVAKVDPPNYENEPLKPMKPTMKEETPPLPPVVKVTEPEKKPEPPVVKATEPEKKPPVVIKTTEPEKKPEPPRDPVVVATPPPPVEVIDPASGLMHSKWKSSLTPEEEKDVKEAIRQGVIYLKRSQLPSGSWSEGGHTVGYAALPGLALLACDVDVDDPFVKRAATYVRRNVDNLTNTYELSLAILFLDRLNGPRDRGKIQELALRLIAGQTTSGGWNYTCPILKKQDEQVMMAYLHYTRPMPLLPTGIVKPLPPPNKQPVVANPMGTDPRLPMGIGPMNPMTTQTGIPKPGDPQFPVGVTEKNNPKLATGIARPDHLFSLPTAIAKDEHVLALQSAIAKAAPDRSSVAVHREGVGLVVPFLVPQDDNLTTPLPTKPGGDAGKTDPKNPMPGDPKDPKMGMGDPKDPKMGDPKNPNDPKMGDPKDPKNDMNEAMKQQTAPPVLVTRHVPLGVLPPALRELGIVTEQPRVNLPAKGKGKIPLHNLKPGRDDNSNTQFAILALWAARRHYVPMERTIALIDHRFHTSQSPNGGWSYTYREGGAGESPQMTGVGLIGLAMGHGSANELVAAYNQWTGRNSLRIQPDADPTIQKALTYISNQIGKRMKPGRGGQRDKLPMANLYFLWTLERVAMLYDLQQVGDKDWYAWSANMLVDHQEGDGSWKVGHYHGSTPQLNTAMALLILNRANFASDLTDNLRANQTLGGKAPAAQPPAPEQPAPQQPAPPQPKTTTQQAPAVQPPPPALTAAPQRQVPALQDKKLK